MRVIIDLGDDYCWSKNIMEHLKFVGAQFFFPPGKYYEYVNRQIIPMSIAEFEAIYDPDLCVLISESTSWELVNEYLI